MNKPLLEKRLRLYKQHKAEVETTKQRISVWEDLLKEGDLSVFEYHASKLLGMPRARAVNGIDTIIANQEVTSEMVRDWIEDDKSRIKYKEVEAAQIESAIKGLTLEQSTVIDLKYFNGLTWRNIEILFNEKYNKNRIYITDEMLRKMNREALWVLWEVLGPLYARLCYGLEEMA